MAINSIGSSSYSSSALTQLNKKQKSLNNVFARLSSGKILSKDRPSAIAVAERLTAQANGYDAANENINYSAGALATAEGALSSITSDLQRMRELAVQGANGIYGEAERGLLNAEFQQLKENIDSTVSSATFNGDSLIDGSFSSDLQVGPNSGDTISVSIDDAGTAAIGVDASSVDDAESASNAIDEIDAALDSIASQQATLGAYNSRLESASYSNAVTSENLRAASSNLTDIDYAAEISNLTLEKIQVLASIKVLKMQSEMKETTLQMLGTARAKQRY